MSKEQFLESIFKQIKDQYPMAKNQREFVDMLSVRVEQYRTDRIKEVSKEMNELLNEGERVTIVMEPKRIQG